MYQIPSIRSQAGRAPVQVCSSLALEQKLSSDQNELLAMRDTYAGMASGILDAIHNPTDAGPLLTLLPWASLPNSAGQRRDTRLWSKSPFGARVGSNLLRACRLPPLPHPAACHHSPPTHHPHSTPRTPTTQHATEHSTASALHPTSPLQRLLVQQTTCPNLHARVSSAIATPSTCWRTTLRESTQAQSRRYLSTLASFRF